MLQLSKIGGVPIDYSALESMLTEYSSARHKIASLEKEGDLIAYIPNLRPRFISSMLTFLEEDLRLDMEQFYRMNPEIFTQCLGFSKKKSDITNLIKLLRR